MELVFSQCMPKKGSIMNWNVQGQYLKVSIYIAGQEVSDILSVLLLKIPIHLDVTLWPLVYRQYNPSKRP